MSGAEEYPLSYQQLTELAEYDGHPEYAIGSCWVYLFRLGPATDLASLRAALRDLVNRHAALRTVVDPNGATAVQRVHDASPTGALGIQSFESLRALTEHISARRPSIADIWAGEDLFRPGLFSVGGSLYLGITIQHLIFDGLSLPVFMRDLTELYAARTQQRPPMLSRTPAAYTDFAVSQHELWHDSSTAALGFWSSVLSGYSGAIDWPAPDPDVDPAAGAEYYDFELPPEGVAEVRRQARASRVSPFSVLLAASGLALARTFDQPDIVIGTDYANRPGAAFRETLGFFANTRFTRFDASRHTSLTDAVKGVAAFWSSADLTMLPPNGALQERLGDFDIVKVGMEIPVRNGATLPLADAITEAVPVPMTNPYWRKLKLQWFTTPSGYSLSVKLQPTLIGRHVPPEIMSHLADVLSVGHHAAGPRAAGP